MKLNETELKLLEKAFEMLDFSYSPYSHFTVGAALLSKSGEIFGGSNIENATYGATNCAERTAVFKAVSEGCRDFQAIAIVGGHEKNVTDFCSPCGICRQVLAEFCGKDFKIILAKSKNPCDDDVKVFTLGELLPEAFNL